MPAHVTLFKTRTGARGGSRLRLSTLFTDAEVVEALPLGTSPVGAIQVTTPPPPNAAAAATTTKSHTYSSRRRRAAATRAPDCNRR